MSTPGDYPPPQQPASGSSNTLGIIGVICAVICWPAGLIIAIIGLNKAKETGAPNGLFKAALIISIVVGVLGIIGGGLNMATLGG